jgi:hypothetical protein
MAVGEEDELLLETPAPEGEDEEEQGSEAEPGEGEDEELEVTFGDGAAPARGEDSDLVRHLRNELRERDKRLASIERDRQPQKIELGPKPTLADCDYDEEAYEQQLDAWKDREAKARQAETEAEKADREVRESWQQELRSHEAKRAALKFPDVQETEETATAALSEVQQAVIVKAAENSALLLYSLGKHPAKLAELSNIKDPLKLAAAVARLEGGLKVMPRRRTAEPEEIVSGNAGVTKGSDKTLAKLEAEAERTGDRTKLIAYRKQTKAPGK